MKKPIHLTLAVALSTLMACSTPATNTTAAADSGNGVVESVSVATQDKGIGLGTIAGGVIGGVLGNQVGSGRGQTAATIAGAAGGAYAGHELEQRRQSNSNAKQVTVRMNDGSHQTLVDDSGTFRPGDRVRVESNGRLIHR
ncbi:MAG: glycine zipper 2TM domain-containing protein [Pseudomonadota bacterium]